MNTATVILYEEGVPLWPAMRTGLDNTRYLLQRAPDAEGFYRMLCEQSPDCAVLAIPRLERELLSLLVRCLSGEGSLPPLVAVVPRIDVATAVGLMRARAHDVVAWPCSLAELRQAIARAVRHERGDAAARAQQRHLVTRMGTLSSAERSLLSLILSDKPNKAIASRIGVGKSTFYTRQKQLLEKMGAVSRQALAEMFIAAGIRVDPANDAHRLRGPKTPTSRFLLAGQTPPPRRNEPA